MFNPIEVATDTENLGVDLGPILARMRGKSAQPQQAINPLSSGKKSIALQLYLVTAEAPPYAEIEYIILAKDEVDARQWIKDQYQESPTSCILIPGPFKNGTILMRREI